MKIAWVYRMISLCFCITVNAVDIFAEDILTTYESLLLFFIVIGFSGLSVAIEETNK